MWLHPDLLPETADPVGSVRHSNVNIFRVLVPCREEGRLYQWAQEDTFIIYDCSPEYGNTSHECFRGTVLEEANGSYSWWQSIDQRGMTNNE